MRGARWISALALATTLLAFVWAGSARAGRPGGGYQLIVNPRNPNSAADRKFVEDAFLKKITRWSGGETIQPVDLAPDSPTRRAFSGSVLKRSVEAVKSYWQARIFSGRDVPPPELDSDDGVVAYVLKHDGAVGYISAGAELRGAKLLAVR